MSTVKRLGSVPELEAYSVRLRRLGSSWGVKYFPTYRQWVCDRRCGGQCEHIKAARAFREAS